MKHTLFSGLVLLSKCGSSLNGTKLEGFVSFQLSKKMQEKLHQKTTYSRLFKSIFLQSILGSNPKINTIKQQT